MSLNLAAACGVRASQRGWKMFGEQFRLGVEKLLQEVGRGRKKAAVIVLRGMICFVCKM